MITILKENLHKLESEDKIKTMQTCYYLKNIQEEIPTINELNKLQKEIEYLEIKYDIFNELSYYFNPLYIKIKNKIHENDVKKIREKNRKKIKMKNNKSFLK